MDHLEPANVFTEVTHIGEADALNSIESLQPGSIVTPFFEVGGSPPHYSPLTEQKSFPENASSGCINEIRLSALEIDETVSSFEDHSQNSEVFDEVITVSRKCSYNSAQDQKLNTDFKDISPTDLVDGEVNVTCTSNFLPKSDLRHVETALSLDSFKGNSKAEFQTETISQLEEEEEEVDYTQVASWRDKPRHLFILSDSGKPIYSRHGDEDKLVTLCGVMQALASVIADSNNDHLWSIRAIGTRISFLARSHLLIVTAAKTGESDRQLIVYLNYAYDFILSVLTLPQLDRIFKKYQNFDLRRMLSGTEKILDHLIDWFDEDMGFLLGSVRCLPLSPALRESINSQLTSSCQKVNGLVFAVVISKKQLISVTRLKKYALHPSDIHLLINLIDASDSFKTAESWIPICLPKFDSSGFMHAYISYLRDSPVCLVYLSVNVESFHALSRSATIFLTKLESSGNLDSILTSMTSASCYKVAQSGVPEIRHFIYKSTSAAQLTSPILSHPYLQASERPRFRGFYRYLHKQMHCPARAAKILVLTSSTEMLLGWITSGFELYAILEPFVTKHQAVLAIEKLIKWIKKEEQQLFILNAPTFS